MHVIYLQALAPEPSHSAGRDAAASASALLPARPPDSSRGLLCSYLLLSSSLAASQVLLAHQHLHLQHPPRLLPPMHPPTQTCVRSQLTLHRALWRVFKGAQCALLACVWLRTLVCTKVARGERQRQGHHTFRATCPHVNIEQSCSIKR